MHAASISVSPRLVSSVDGLSPRRASTGKRTRREERLPPHAMYPHPPHGRLAEVSPRSPGPITSYDSLLTASNRARSAVGSLRACDAPRPAPTCCLSRPSGRSLYRVGRCRHGPGGVAPRQRHLGGEWRHAHERHKRALYLHTHIRSLPSIRLRAKKRTEQGFGSSWAVQIPQLP